VISGVGHETDVTIADFAADERAPTPSGAAERAVPDSSEFLRALGALERNLAAAMHRKLRALGQALHVQQRGLARTHPGARLRQHAQRLDDFEQRLQRSVLRRLGRSRERLERARALLGRSSPARRLATLRLRLERAAKQLPLCMQRRVQRAHDRFGRATRTLHAVSPLATLDRGYAIVLDEGGRVVSDATSLAAGAAIEARLARGSLRATVSSVLGPPSSKAVPDR
jgi:exodeoxyribonuclease VII large subunit